MENMENIESVFEKIRLFFILPSSEAWFLNIKIIFTIIILISVGFIVLALFKTSWLKMRFLYNFIEFLTYRPFGTRKIEKDWKKIRLRTEKGLESEYKLAIIEADSMFDNILKQMKYEGESLGEKLEKITISILSNIEEVRQAHQVRNNIVHDPNYKLSLDETRKTLDIFEESFKSLDVF